MNLHLFIPITFIIATGLTFFFFHKATAYSKAVLFLMLGWLILHGILAFVGFYENVAVMPPRILITFAPVLFIILALFTTAKGRIWISKLDLKALTLLHVVRIPVELVLYWLFLNKAVPELMTFTGRNFDILAGITAPFVYYFGFVKKNMGSKVLLFWNIICLALLLNIVISALLSAPLPFQQYAFEQPNIAVLYFPFIWLPSFVVPIVLFSHIVAIKRLL